MAWPAVRARLGAEMGLPSGTPVHHWLIPQGGTGQLSVQGVLGMQWGRAVPDVIKNAVSGRIDVVRDFRIELV
jgi:hypothetical protein